MSWVGSVVIVHPNKTSHTDEFHQAWQTQEEAELFVQYWQFEAFKGQSDYFVEGKVYESTK